MSSAKTEVQKLIDEHNVIVFSKTWCGFSSSTKSLLRSLDADFEIVELDEHPDGSAFQAALEEISGQRTVPNIFIDHKHVGGNSDLKTLSSTGRLKVLLKNTGALKE